jgi:endonuclease/exonuclease/phosphatase family metal-dependent hydrolase
MSLEMVPVSGGRLRVVTLNTWKCEGAYALRMQAMVEQLQPLHADVLVLQESFASADGAVSTARTLAHAMQMEFAWVPDRPKSRLCDGRWMESHSGLAVLSRWPILENRSVALPSSEADGGRVAQLCRLVVPSGPLWLANVHLSHLSHGTTLRHQQLAHLLQSTATLTMGEPLLVCGDFNAPLVSAEMWIFLGRPWGLCDTWPACKGPKVTHITEQRQAVDLDHVLQRTTTAWPVLNTEVVLQQASDSLGVSASDHFGVLVDLAS